MSGVIDVVQLGPSLESMTYGSVQTMLDADVLVLQSDRPGACRQILGKRKGKTVSLDDLFESTEDFDSLYEAGAERILSFDGRVVFGCVGAPEDNGFVRCLRRSRDAQSEGGFDPVTEALRAAGAGAPYAVADARTLGDLFIDTSAAFVVTAVDDAFTAAEAKIILSDSWPADTEITVLKDGEARRTQLAEIDRVQDWGSGGTLVLPAQSLVGKARHTFADLLEVMRRLRAPGGCPWDAEQTHETLRPYLIEESYEVADAVDSGDIHALYDELGDVLLQVVFHAQIGKESGEFDIGDVTSAVCEKMIRRHPHVFGDVHVAGSDEVLRNWDSIKRAEKKEKTWTESMRDIPAGMGALLRAVKIQKKAANLGFEWPAPEGALEKVREETSEFEAELPAGGRALEAEGGDMLFAVVNALRMKGIDPETALRGACEKFVRRFGYIEEHAGKDLQEMSLEDMDALWNEAKKFEGGRQS